MKNENSLPNVQVDSSEISEADEGLSPTPCSTVSELEWPPHPDLPMFLYVYDKDTFEVKYKEESRAQELVLQGTTLLNTILEELPRKCQIGPNDKIVITHQSPEELYLPLQLKMTQKSWISHYVL